MLVKGMYKSKSYNFCFKQLTMNFIYIGSQASSIRSTATIKQFNTVKTTFFSYLKMEKKLIKRASHETTTTKLLSSELMRYR